VKWTTAIKEVLSGLSAKSNGTGRNKATVEHILLLENMKVGRLKRGAGDFLCSNSRAIWGAGYTDMTSMVTCKACLAIAERLGKAAKRKP